MDKGKRERKWENMRETKGDNGVWGSKRKTGGRGKGVERNKTKNKEEAIRSKHIKQTGWNEKRSMVWWGKGWSSRSNLNMKLVFSIHIPRYMGIYNCTDKYKLHILILIKIKGRWVFYNPYVILASFLQHCSSHLLVLKLLLKVKSGSRCPLLIDECCWVANLIIMY